MFLVAEADLRGQQSERRDFLMNVYHANVKLKKELPSQPHVL
jgi:hypothetical protein